MGGVLVSTGKQARIVSINSGGSSASALSREDGMSIKWENGKCLQQANRARIVSISCQVSCSKLINWSIKHQASAGRCLGVWARRVHEHQLRGVWARGVHDECQLGGVFGPSQTALTANAHDGPLLRLPADAHDARLLACSGVDTSQLMLMMRALLLARAKTPPSCSHDAPLLLRHQSLC